jgi:signal transduction histidine kinase
VRSLAVLTRRERDAIALALPALAVALTYASWSILSPSSWFFFYPAVFVAAWIGSVPAGLTATVASAVLCYYCFTYPRYTWILTHPADLWMVALFVAMGGLFTLVFDRLRLQRARATAAEMATLRAEDRERIARDLHDLVIQRMFAIGLQLEAIDHDTIGVALGDRLNEVCGEMDDVIRTVRSTVFELRPATDERATV